MKIKKEKEKKFVEYLLIFVIVFLFLLVFLGLGEKQIMFSDEPFDKIGFVSPTPEDGEIISTNLTGINISILEPALTEFVFNWDGFEHNLYDDSLMLMLNFDDAGGVVEDLSPYVHNVDLVGSSYDSNGVRGGSRYFDFGEALVVDDLSGVNFPQEQGTISFWMYGDFTSKGDSNYIFDTYDSSRNHIMIRMAYPSQNAMQIEFQEADGNYLLGNLVVYDLFNDFEWNHVAITYDVSSTLVRVYINGRLRRVRYLSNPNWIIDQQIVRIGHGFQDLLDEFRIYNREMQHDEIRELYSSYLLKNDLGNWNFFINQLLVDGTHEYSGFMKNFYGEEFQTETRKINANLPAPLPRKINVDVDFESPDDIIDFIYGIQEEGAVHHLATLPFVADNHGNVATYDRIWLRHMRPEHGFQDNIPLQDDCTNYDYTKILNLTQTVLNHGLTPYISFGNFPRCMIPSGSSYSTVKPVPPISPWEYSDFAEYAANVVNYFYISCNDGTINNCGDFENWRWEILNEPGDEYWLNSNDYKYAELYELTYTAIKDAVPIAKVGSAGSLGPETEPIVEFFSHIDSEIYPDFVSIHQYDDAEIADDGLPGYEGFTFEEFLSGTKGNFYDYMNEVVELIEGYSSDIELFNFEYGMSGSVSPRVVKFLTMQEACVWHASSLYWATQSDLTGEAWYHGTDGGGVPSQGMWIINDDNELIETKPVFYTKKEWVDRFPRGSNMFLGVSNDEAVEVMATDDNLVVINKLNFSVNVELDLINKDVNKLISHEGEAIYLTGGEFNLALDNFEVIFYSFAKVVPRDDDDNNDKDDDDDDDNDNNNDSHDDNETNSNSNNDSHDDNETNDSEENGSELEEGFWYSATSFAKENSFYVLLIVLVIGVAVVGYFVYRKTKEKKTFSNPGFAFNNKIRKFN